MSISECLARLLVSWPTLGVFPIVFCDSVCRNLLSKIAFLFAEQKTLSALRCLGFFLMPKSKVKKSKSTEVQSGQVTDVGQVMDVPYILIQAPVSIVTSF